LREAEPSNMLCPARGIDPERGPTSSGAIGTDGRYLMESALDSPVIL